MIKLKKSDLTLIMNGGQEMWCLYINSNNEHIITAYTGGLAPYEYAFLIKNIHELIGEFSNYYVSRLANDLNKLQKYCQEIHVE